MLATIPGSGRKESSLKPYAKTSSIAATAFLSLGLIFGAGAPAQADTGAASEVPAASAEVTSVQQEIKQVDESNLAFRLSEGDKLAADGTAVVSVTGDRTPLPQESVDSNGDVVDLRYAEEDGVVTVNVLQPGISQQATTPHSSGISTMGLSDGWKCGLGTGGSAGTGAIAGGAAGATIGSAVPVAGTAAGWALGTAIGGAVSGGAVGAATFC